MRYFRDKRSVCLAMVAVAAFCMAWSQAVAADPYKYNIVEITNAAPGHTPVIKFSVTNTATGKLTDLRSDPAWLQTATRASRLFLQIGWDTRDFHNTNSGSNSLPGVRGAALPIPVDALGTLATANSDGTYSVTSPLPIPATATGTGEVAMEGHPAGKDPVTGLLTVAIPIKSVYKYFPITGTAVVPRRQIVDVNKCMACHKSAGNGVAPRLTLHGSNRTEEPVAPLPVESTDSVPISKQLEPPPFMQ